MDGEFVRRKPTKGPHREVVGAAVVDSEQFCEIIQREEGMTGIEAFLVFSVTAFHLAVVAGSVGTDKLVANPKFGGSGFKE